MKQPLLTIRQAAETLSVSTKTIRRLIDAGELEATNIATTGKQARWRIPERQLTNFLRRRRRT